MRRSTRLETAAANGKRAARISARIAAHAAQMLKDAGEAEWEPGQDDDENDNEDEDEHLSDSDFSDEPKPRTRAALAGRSKRRAIEVSDSDSSGEEAIVRAPVKQEQHYKTTDITKARAVMSRIRQRDQAIKATSKRPKLHHQSIEMKEEVDVPTTSKPPVVRKKVSAAKSTEKERDATADSHRRPTKLQQHAPSARETISVSSVKLPSATKNNTLTHFFHEILEWNLYDALRRESQKDYEFSAANDGSEEGEVEVAKVPSQFDSYDHYFSVWKPLALEEVQAQTVNSVTTDRPTAALISTTTLSTASFASKTSKVRVETKKQGYKAKYDPSKEVVNGLFVNDLVVITPDRNYFEKALGKSSSRSGRSHRADSGAESTVSDVPLGVLGLVASQKSSREGLIISVLSTAWSIIDQEADMYLFKLNNLVTSVREFRALCDCRDYQLMPLILSGRHESGSMRLDSLGLEYVRWLTRSFNESQLEAITAAATSHGFTLIKGPPGTGKTTTLKGLLNSLHLREYSRYYNAVLDVARRPDHETNRAWAAIGNEKPHILVTAPSNAAVDNIVGKVIEEGFCDGEGRRYFPKIVRVGRGMSANVRSVGLDDMVDQICGQPADVLEHNIIRLRHELFTVERDAVNLREHLRQIVAWIDRDPVAALSAHVQPQTMPPLDIGTGATDATGDSSPRSPSPPPPPTSPPTDQHASWSPDPPGPPTPPGPEGHLELNDTATGAPDFAAYSVENDEEDEEDEAFPTSYGHSAMAPGETSGTYNAEESGKAFSAFFDDSSPDEDEPLPNESSSGRDSKQVPQSEAKDRTAPTYAAPDEAMLKVDVHDESDEDEPLPNGSNAKLPNQAAPAQSPPPEATRSADVKEYGVSTSVASDQVDATSAAMTIDIPEDTPMSPPPPPPPLSPLSPPPPPPLSPPPPLTSAGFQSDSRPSSPTVMPLSPPPPPADGDATTTTSGDEPIEYTKYQEYRAIAQQINFCLEKLAELKLELQRYEFARKTVSERGKLNPATRQSLEVSFLDTAHIVFTTLSSAGVAALDASSRYDVLVVDEAAQAVELSTVIPMKFGSRQCVLVGDPQQLSATVFSRTSGQSLYERSMFERLESCGHPVHMLRTQYRSHPMISDFPRNYFYEGKLQDGENVQSEAYAKPYHQLGPAFTPLVFWNLLSSREASTKSVSRMNVGEAELAVNLYLTLKNSCPPDAVAGKVGMITPYSQQMDELKKRFRRTLGDRYDSEIEINTVDGFQGREKDIIILSTVRADPRAGVGFLNDIRRMNVSLTRAKFACYVIGSEPTLRSSKPWSALLDHAYNRHCIVHVESPTCNLLTLRPMEQPSSGRSKPPQSAKHSHAQSSTTMVPPPFVFPPQRQLPGAMWPPSQQMEAGTGHSSERHNNWRGRGRGEPSRGGRGGRRPVGQRSGRGNSGYGRDRGRQDYFAQPQAFHANAPQPDPSWQSSGMAPPPPMAERGGHAMARGRGNSKAPLPSVGALGTYPQQRQALFMPGSGYDPNGALNAGEAGRGGVGVRKPRDPRSRAGGRGSGTSTAGGDANFTNGHGDRGGGAIS